MNVRLTPRDQPQRTDLYGGVTRVASDGTWLSLERAGERVFLFKLPAIAEIALDDEPGAGA